MARIDLLTAQMRQRAVNRASVQSDEKIQLFDAHDQLLGAGAALPHQTIHEILTQIAPGPLDGVPVAFPYRGPDGEFEVSVAPEARGFEIRALSFAPAHNEPLQNHSTPETQSAVLDTPTTTTAPPAAADGGWFYLAGDQQLGPQTNAQMKNLIRSGGIRRHTYLWREGMGEWIPVGQSEFHTLLPALPNARGDSEDTWYYRSMTGQPVPVDKNALVNKIRAGELNGESWVWHQGMSDWESASKTELSSALNARPVGLPPVGGAPIASPTGGPRTLPGTGPYNLYGGGDPENNSGGGEGIEVPKKACGLFNMGAFLFPVFWCHSMGMPSWATGIVVFNVASRYIPFIGLAKLPLCIYLGIMGNRLAWRNRRFNSIEDFRRCQLIWGIVSSAIWAVLIVVALVFLGSFVSQVMSTAGSTPGRSGQTFNLPQSAGGK